jgi:2-dehydro-3-deoxyphosphogluconate aldolase / (4S)-4-hydroxy-2-oxoglutarate aldolase
MDCQSRVGRDWEVGADFVKVFPCVELGGKRYIRALKRALPQIPLIAAEGVNQQTAANCIFSNGPESQPS